MLSAGELIWASSRPLIRLVLCVAAGFVLTKTDNFPPVAARGAAQIMLNITLPSLMFSKIVPAFTADNISALGPLVLVALVYEGLGIVMAWIIKQFFWVPHRFRYGILVAGGWANVGDIPTSVIVSVTGAAPFNGTDDENLSIAYIAVFILVFMVTLFPCGGNRWIAMDFAGLDIEPEEVHEMVRRRRGRMASVVPNVVSWLFNHQGLWRRLGISKSEACETTDAEQGRDGRVGVSGNMTHEELSEKAEGEASKKNTARGKHVSFQQETTTPHNGGMRSPPRSPTPTDFGLSQSHFTSATPTVVAVAENSHLATHDHRITSPTPTHPPSLDSSRTSKYLRSLRSFFTSLLSPPSLTILISFPIALIPQLKALFVPLPSPSSINIAPAPDGQPPLAFFLDTTTFIGAASVPLGLICLGTALARLSVPRSQWGTLPLGAISSLAICKMIISPVLGVGIVQGLVRSGLIPREDKVLQFVCILLSCLPTATTQVYLTQVFSGTGSAEHLPAFLIPQYILMFFSLTGLTAYTLQSLF